MTDTEAKSRAEELGEMRIQMVENVEDGLKDYRDGAESMRSLLEAHRQFTDPGNVRPFLSGVEVGLQLAEHEVANLNCEIMYGEGSRGPEWDTGDVEDEKVERVLMTLLGEANNGNWGNVAVNADRLEQAAEDADKPECNECGELLGDEWREAEAEAKEKDEHPAPCPNCGENPLPPVGGDDP